MIKMLVITTVLLFLFGANGLKTWISNTDINNTLNWDNGDLPKNCDDLHFPIKSDVAAYWNIKDIAVSGLKLSRTGELIFPNNIYIHFKNPEKCVDGRKMKYTRTGIKGWLDPDNWMSDSTQWYPHSERVPCSGEDIFFPPGNTVSVQLPSILLPIKNIYFDNKKYDGQDWQSFLNSELGFQLFKGPEDIRNLPWRTDIGCLNKKKCSCARSAYTIRDGVYKEVSQNIFEEAICLYAMPKCKPLKCYSPVVPQGHCCGICGAILNLEDTTEEGLDLDDIKVKIDMELKEHNVDKELKTYVGRTKNENIQIVIVAEYSGATPKSHFISSAIAQKLTGKQHNTKISTHLSGLTFSNYIFNDISGIIFGTLLSVIILFFALYYIYVILPQKNLNMTESKPFVFARFDNTLNEDNYNENVLIESVEIEGSRQAFDNPIYSEDSSSSYETNKNKEITKMEANLANAEGASSQEYHNLTYDDLQTPEKLDIFNSSEGIEKNDQFSEINL